MPAATAAMPSSASPRPAPSSASRSGTTSAPGSLSPETQPSPTSRNSSLSVAQQPNPPGLLPLLRLRERDSNHNDAFQIAAIFQRLRRKLGARDPSSRYHTRSALQLLNSCRGAAQAGQVVTSFHAFRRD